MYFEPLYLATSGSLEGKFIYLKALFTQVAYLKKCSSILGYSYVRTSSDTLMIADKLDMNVLLSPTGAFEAFKRQASTICLGKAVVI